MTRREPPPGFPPAPSPPAAAKERIVEQVSALAGHLNFVVLDASIRLLGSRDPAALPAARHVAAVTADSAVAAVRVSRSIATPRPASRGRAENTGGRP